MLLPATLQKYFSGTRRISEVIFAACSHLSTDNCGRKLLITVTQKKFSTDLLSMISTQFHIYELKGITWKNLCFSPERKLMTNIVL